MQNNLFADLQTATGRLQDYLHRAIPLVTAMQVSVSAFDGKYLVLRAPLAPNANHQGTGFGGSLHGLATLACWGIVWLLLERLPETNIVVAESRMRYLAPVTSDLVAEARVPGPIALERFRSTLARRGRARVDLAARIVEGAGDRAVFQATFVASLGRQAG